MELCILAAIIIYLPLHQNKTLSIIANKTVLVTGGASGIGKLMGENCLQRGARRLIIWDIDAEKLNFVKDEFIKQGYDVIATTINLTDTPAIQEAAKEITALYGGVDILFNNAGIITSNLFFHDMEHAEIDRTMQVNTQAHMHVTLALLPAMIHKKSGHIVNISSAAGFIPNPRLSVYCASKHALTGWSESLRLELERMDGDFHVTTVTPAYIDTGMFAGVRSPLIPIAKPATAAQSIIKGVLKNKICVRIPLIVYIAPFFRGILPQRWSDFLIGRVFGFAKSMDDFKGRNAK